MDTAGQRLTRAGAASAERPLDFAAIQRLMQQAAGLPQDLSVEQFLERHAPGETRAAERHFVRRMVEGFDAADPREASAQAIAAEWGGQSMGGQYRPLGGYGPLLGALTRALTPERTRLMLGTVVREVEWGGDRVRALVRSGGGEATLSAAQAIVTLPVSLLQSAAPGAVRFTPALHEKRTALAALAMGPVIKVVMHFRQAFWEHLDEGRFADVGFLHAPDAPFPTLWTSLPYRVPVLTAWMGGPRAAPLAGVAPAVRLGQALQSVQSAFDLSEPPETELIAAHQHDWGEDAYARGAYCYRRVGGAAAPDELARPLASRLYFAGEATHPDYTGTVEAALQSGRRAAAALLAAGRR